MSQLKLEAGKYYKARNGEKVFISHIAHENPFLPSTKDRYPAKGWIRGQGTLHGWAEDGMRYVGDDHSPSDLIEEWKEPATKEAVIGLYRSNDGQYQWFGKFNHHDDYWTLVGSRRIMLKEGEFIE